MSSQNSDPFKGLATIARMLRGTNNPFFKRKKRAKEPITYYELLELEKQKNDSQSVKITIKRNFPIASDGFIPNSVVRKFFQLLDPTPKQPEKKIWKLKWKPSTVIAEEERNQDSPVYTGQNLYFDWTSEEEGAEGEDKQEINEQSDSKNNIDQALNDLFKRLKEHDWFKQPKEINIDNLMKSLIGTLITRDPSNHSDITNYILEITDNFRLRDDLVEWIFSMLEDEFDGPDSNIILDTLKIISNFGRETYNFDLGFLNLIDQRNRTNEFKKEALQLLCNLTGVNENSVSIVLSELKRLQNPKYKKLSNFKLKNFLQEIESERAANSTPKDKENETKSETFKAILREDWIPTATKDTLKTLKDFLNYLLKALATIKSKIFYEKIANYYNALYNEFNLEKTEWEKKIINHFINSNTDPKTNEQLRLVDMENLEKYLGSIRDQEIKNEIFVELLRSASQEKSRTLVIKAASELLEKYSKLDSHYVEDLIKYYSKHVFNKELKWPELLKNYQMRSKDELVENTPEEENASKELDSEIDNTSGSKIKGKSKKEKKDKKEKVKKTKKTVKLIEEITPEVIHEVTEPLEYKPKSVEPKPQKQNTSITTITKLEQPSIKNEITDSKKDKSGLLSQEKVEKHIEKTSANKKNEKTTSKLSEGSSNKNGESSHQKNSDSNSKLDKNTVNNNSSARNFSNFAPNKIETWDYYEKRNELAKIKSESEKVQTNNKNLDLNTLNDITFKDENIDNFILEENSQFIGEHIHDKDETNSKNKKYNEKSHSSFQLSSIDIDSLNEDFDLNKDLINIIDTKRKVSAKEMLEGITKRVVLNEMNNEHKYSTNSLDPGFSMDRLNPRLLNEKSHLFLEPLMNLRDEHKNMILRNLNLNKRRRDIEYNQLLECLIIRASELHTHYEKLLPVQTMYKHNETFVPIPYFSDFLVVHQYNSKLSTHSTNNNLINNTNEETSIYNNGPKKENLSFDKQLSNLETLNIYPTRKSNRTNNWRGSQLTNEAKIGEFDLNHLFILNKLLISYGPHNIRQFYANINANFKNYIKTLHSRIPHRIIPLIWNDPVIQKLAKILSSASKMNNGQETKSDSDYFSRNIAKKSQSISRSLPNSFARSKTVAIDPGKSDDENNDESSNEVYPNKKSSIPLPSIRHFKVTSKGLYDHWPQFKSHETPRNKMVKKKLYSHIMSMKHEYVKLQWRHMLNGEKETKSSYLPPLSYKATLNELDHKTS